MTTDWVSTACERAADPPRDEQSTGVVLGDLVVGSNQRHNDALWVDVGGIINGGYDPRSCRPPNDMDKRHTGQPQRSDQAAFGVLVENAGNYQQKHYWGEVECSVCGSKCWSARLTELQGRAKLALTLVVEPVYSRSVQPRPFGAGPPL